MADLVQEDKVRYSGLCEATGPELRAAHTIHPTTAPPSESSRRRPTGPLSNVTRARPPAAAT
ncbi:hypothetical protein HLK59_11540 [Streptomyces sp. S3(2020)]|uniref:hypothetical protein n=1 Tax=Streptomyces sp. S3(2020) TaxID=2732044 RepID=UPI001488A479|nr:hypothetical protein [Streptomyces sp. S3(2020)]NNN30992.1 hypothetical protein [Streptomyces sp. S3(2020)]